MWLETHVLFSKGLLINVKAFMIRLKGYILRCWIQISANHWRWNDWNRISQIYMQFRWRFLRIFQRLINSTATVWYCHLRRYGLRMYSSQIGGSIHGVIKFKWHLMFSREIRERFIILIRDSSPHTKRLFLTGPSFDFCIFFVCQLFHHIENIFRVWLVSTVLKIVKRLLWAY